MRLKTQSRKIIVAKSQEGQVSERDVEMMMMMMMMSYTVWGTGHWNV
jgi:hypothetical protein